MNGKLKSNYYVWFWLTLVAFGSELDMRFFRIMLLKLLLFAFVSSVCGEVVIQVSSIRSKKVKFRGNELSSNSPSDRLTMSFVKNGLLIQTNNDSVLFNYEKKFLEWTEFKTKTEQTLQKISFNDIIVF